MESRDTLLYVFSPTCHWCELNVDNIRTIVQTRRDLRVIGVNIGSELTRQQTEALPFSIILTPTRETARNYRLSATPTTLLVSSKGIVLRNWPGAYGGAIAADVAKVLAVSLPGLRSD